MTDEDRQIADAYAIQSADLVAPAAVTRAIKRDLIELTRDQ
jgi:hypothetical protein